MTESLQDEMYITIEKVKDRLNQLFTLIEENDKLSDSEIEEMEKEYDQAHYRLMELEQLVDYSS
jgi:uncharacterized protein Yka (UPF0111/DUF47 family)